jgi:hypothetical protein
MSSRLTRTLLKLYPRRIRDWYGDELLGLQDELRAKGDVSRMRLIGDMLAAALRVRPARWVCLTIAALLVIGGLAMAGAIIGGRGTGTPVRASRPQVRLAVQSATANPYRTCSVAGGSSCSLAPCSQTTGQPSAEGAVAYTSPPITRSRPRVTVTRCARYPHVRPHRPIFVGE